MSQPPAQLPVNGVFTTSLPMFIITEQSPKKPPRVPSPMTAAFLCSLSAQPTSTLASAWDDYMKRICYF